MPACNYIYTRNLSHLGYILIYIAIGYGFELCTYLERSNLWQHVITGGAHRRTLQLPWEVLWCYHAPESPVLPFICWPVFIGNITHQHAYTAPCLDNQLSSELQCKCGVCCHNPTGCSDHLTSVCEMCERRAWHWIKYHDESGSWCVHLILHFYTVKYVEYRLRVLRIE